MKLEFHPAASEEFIAAVEYYEAALPGLGRRFLLAVRKTIELLTLAVANAILVRGDGAPPVGRYSANATE